MKNGYQKENIKNFGDTTLNSQCYMRCQIFIATASRNLNE